MVSVPPVFECISDLVSSVLNWCHRSASAAEEESFENDLEQQLEDELKLEELMKHRQEADKTCMVRIYWNEEVT